MKWKSQKKEMDDVSFPLWKWTILWKEKRKVSLGGKEREGGKLDNPLHVLNALC